MTRADAGLLSDLPPGALRRVEHGGAIVCVARTLDGNVYAIDDACTHEQSSMSEQGELLGTEIECLMHGSTFDLATGAVTGPPATTPIRTHRVHLDGDRVFVDL